MITCESCGARQEAGASFCGSCGAFVGWAAPDQPARPDPGGDAAQARPDPEPITVEPPPPPPHPAPRPRSDADRDGRPDPAVQEAIECVEAGARLAVQQDRPDLAARLAATRTRLADQVLPVAVVGEFKRGKSTLVNALLRTSVCPVDADIVTAVPTLVRYGDVASATAFYEPGEADRPPRAEPLTLRDLPGAVSELGRTGGPRPNSVEVRLRHRLLRTGLCLVDTPGVGGLDSAHGVVTLGALELAQGVLFVTDASQELTAPEVAFLRMALQRCPVAACVVTKTDLYPHWRRIVELDAAHLARAGLDLPVIGVSSFLRLRPVQDPALAEESGFRPLFELLATRVVGAGGARAARSAASDVRFVAAQLGRQVEAERRVVTRPHEAEQVVARLASAQERTARLASPSAGWQQVLSEKVQDLVADVEHDLARRLRTLVRDVEEVIDRSDPKDAWPDVEAWLRREAAAAAVATYDGLTGRAGSVAVDVAAQFDLEAGTSVGLDLAAPTGVIGEIDVGALGSLDAGGRLSTALLAVRSGSFVPMVLFAAVSHLPVGVMGLAGAAILGPLGLALGAVIVRKVVRDERTRQLTHRRQLAKAEARRFLDEVAFLVGKDCRDSLRLAGRRLREELGERAAAMHRSSLATLDAAREARGLDTEGRTRRAAALDERTATLRRLQRELADVAAAAPAEAVRGG